MRTSHVSAPGVRVGAETVTVKWSGPSTPPWSATLADKTVVVGTGGIGAPSAIEFAKAVVAELRIYDRDWVEPATSVRYPLGYVDAGRLKVFALRDHLASHYPLVRVDGRPLRLGGARRDAKGMSEVSVLAEMLDGADLVYDGTADHGTSLYLCDLALRQGVPYVGASTTHGAWGGRVVRFWPDRGIVIKETEVRARSNRTERPRPPRQANNGLRAPWTHDVSPADTPRLSSFEGGPARGHGS